MKEFVIRGQTAKGLTHTINFGGHKGGYGFKLIEFDLYGSFNVGAADAQMTAVITAGKTALDPQNPDFTDEGLIASAHLKNDANDAYPISSYAVINDTFVITQDVLLTVYNNEAHPVNWQCKFIPVKLTVPEEALANYRQFSIFDE